MPTPTKLPLLLSQKPEAADAEAVRYLQTCLNSQGYHMPVTGKYDKATIGAVHDFQAAHLAPTGAFLTVDGDVGADTWWALQNPSGAAQKSGYDPIIPKGLSATRRGILNAALKDWRKGVHEIPDGANWGGGVERYLQGIGPAYWCCAAVSTWVKDATQSYPFGERVLACARLWELGGNKGQRVDKHTTPVPGDAFVLLFKNARGQLTGSGHTGLVLSVSADGESFNTIEGNAGNRVKVGLRSCEEGVLVGFVDLVGDRKDVLGKFARGLLSKTDQVASSAGGTR